jgi:phage terminase large subunit-like protein
MKRMPKPPRPWYNIARPKQLPPDHPDHCKSDRNGYYCRWYEKDGTEHRCEGQDDWYIWLLLAGRGAGKTLSGSNWILENALKYPNTRWAVVAPTYGQVQKVCFKGDSGIIAQALPGEITFHNRAELVIYLQNGSEIHGFSAENPERARGFNLSGAWLDEVGSFRGTEIWDEVLQPALRKGDPKVVVTTTPSTSLLLKRWYDLFINETKAGRPCDIHLTHSTFRENYALPPKRVEALEKEYAGTRAGRQELEGEMLEDFEGALWKREFIENYRIQPEDFDITCMNRIVVAVDPSMTSGERADESGIVVAGMDNNKEGYLIADLSCHGTPERVMRIAVDAYYGYQADCVVMEANQGGDFLTAALRAVDPGVPPRIVHAQKGKLIRAQPISMLAEQGRLHHVGYFPKLEDQLCVMTPDNKREHDDRADAFVWAFAELRGITEGSYLDVYGYRKCESCQFVFSKTLLVCARCGWKPLREEKPVTPGDWARAYKNICRKCGGAYPQREPQCPNCTPNPMGYMAQVAKFTGNQTGWVSYQGKSWL